MMMTGLPLCRAAVAASVDASNKPPSDERHTTSTCSTHTWLLLATTKESKSTTLKQKQTTTNSVNTKTKQQHRVHLLCLPRVSPQQTHVYI